MRPALLVLSTSVVACGGTLDADFDKLCPTVVSGDHELLVPEDRQPLVDLCGSRCFPFFGEVRRESDDCADRQVTSGEAALCAPTWAGDCKAVDLRLELIGCAPKVALADTFSGGVAECRVNADEGAVVLTGSSFWPLGEEQWRPCSTAEQQSIFCD